jgi:hypothetical protein
VRARSGLAPGLAICCQSSCEFGYTGLEAKSGLTRCVVGLGDPATFRISPEQLGALHAFSAAVDEGRDAERR